MRSHPLRFRVAGPLLHAAAALALLLVPGALPLGARADDSAAPIAAQELAERLEAGTAPLVLDVRTPKEYERGRVPQARNIPYDEVGERLDELPAERDREIAVYCHSGKRAAVAEKRLREAGYTNVRDLTGHWQSWSATDLPREE